MPRLDGVAATKVIKELYPDVEVVVLTSFSEAEPPVPTSRHVLTKLGLKSRTQAALWAVREGLVPSS